MTSAGNDPNIRLENKLPQALGTDSNTVITVGGVNEDGQIWEKSSPEGSGGGSLTVWAQSQNVKCYLPSGIEA